MFRPGPRVVPPARRGRCVSKTDPLFETARKLGEAEAYLKKTPKAFEKIVAKGEIPKHYLTERGILFSRKELDEWLLER
jgi:hypothetical protein